MKRIGFLGGTFDPPHFGHVNAVVAVKEACNLDEIVICPTSLSPDKVDAPPSASASDRLEMVKLAFESVDGARIDEREIHQPGICYTIDSLRELKGKIFLLVGEDVVKNLPKWQSYQEILKISTPLIVARVGSHASTGGYERAEIPLFDISSTDIRQRLAKKQFCSHLVPAKVLDYIRQNGLYSSP